MIGNPLREKREGPGRVSDAGPSPHFPTPSGSRTEATVAHDGGGESCVICEASIIPADSGLCDAHKYDDQPGVVRRA